MLCSESFLEAVKNCDYSFAKHLNVKSLFNNPFINNFNISYVSNASFFENKHGISEEQLNSTVPTLVVRKSLQNLHATEGFYQKLVSGLLNENKFTFNIQTRGFKTERSIEAELKRNPPIISRLKNNLGSSSELSNKVTLGSSVTETEHLKKLLASEDSTLTDSEKQRIKLAFAEGYLLGNTNAAKGGKAGKYIRIVQQVLTIAVVLAILLTVMSSSSGSMFR